MSSRVTASGSIPASGKQGKVLCQVFLFHPEGENAPVRPGENKVHQHLLDRAGEIGFHLVLDDLFHLLGLRKGKGELADKGLGAREEATIISFLKPSS